MVFAQQRAEQEALHALETARSLYPEHPENDPSFLYAEFSLASMILEEGLTYLALAQQFSAQRYNKKALDSFGYIETLRTERNISERILFEIVNSQAETALTLKDLELFRAYITEGIEGANKLNSKQRRQEIIDVCKQAHNLWPHEINVEDVKSQMFHLVDDFE